MVDANKLIKQDNGLWVMSWMELDKTDDGEINISRFGTKFKFCPFCGKEIII